MSLTVGMCMRNEAQRYLPEVLGQAATYANRMVVLDDCSEDASAAIASRLGAEVFHTAEPLFTQEWRLRSMLWDLVIDGLGHGDWVLILDADEIFGAGIAQDLQAMMAKPDCQWGAFHLYDLWDSRTQYRDDDIWNAHRRWSVPVVRYDGVVYEFAHRDQHCGRLPVNAIQGCGVGSDVPWLHLGWITSADRRRKYRRYMEHDPTGCCGSLSQYHSILDPAPHLSALKEDFPCGS